MLTDYPYDKDLNHKSRELLLAHRLELVLHYIGSPVQRVHSFPSSDMVKLRREIQNQPELSAAPLCSIHGKEIRFCRIVTVIRLPRQRLKDGLDPWDLHPNSTHKDKVLPLNCLNTSTSLLVSFLVNVFPL